MKRKIFFGLMIIFGLQVFGQPAIFMPADAPKGRVIYDKDRMPADYKLVWADKGRLTAHLREAPYQFDNTRSQVVLRVPLPDGQMVSFAMYKTRAMSEEMAKQFPQFQTYMGKEIGGAMHLRLNVHPSGIYMAVYGTDHGRVIWQPYDNAGTLIMYYAQDAPPLKLSCAVDGTTKEWQPEETGTVSRPAFSDRILRTFRLAYATTGEFSQYHIQRAIQNGTLDNNATDQQKKQAVLDALVVIVNRVNEVYETDLGIHLELISGTNTIFLDPNNDPYTNDNSQALLSENQRTMDRIIGSANYDIGHVGSTYSGGLAGLGVVCRDGVKARGETGLPSPIGDHYAIDFVAHEMGHQFGANHTFANSCGGNRNDNTAVEPGSGSTIMAYAGVCPPNIQDFSDPYFHYVSIMEIKNYLMQHDCSQHTQLQNRAPVASMGPQRYIPKETPFVLEVTASDEDNDTLTYTFDQTDVYRDPGQTDAPPRSTNTTGPLFRSFPATERSYRYFPQMADIINGNYGNTWEVLPSVSRVLSFKAVVRDNNPEGGQIATPGVVLGVDANAGPFRLTSQTSDENWLPGQQVNITWDVAGTNEGHVNTPTVDILLSLDNGDNFDVVLAENVPNDGAETITVPDINTTTGRLMVRGHGNYFFDASRGRIVVGNYQEVCSEYSNNHQFTIPDNNSQGINSNILVTDTGAVSKVTVHVNITHTYIQDLHIQLISPQRTVVDLFRRNCGREDNMNVTFSDEGQAMNCSQMNNNLVFKPVGHLSDLIGENMQGRWTLHVSDNQRGDEGVLNSWSLQVCKMEMDVEKIPVEGLKIYPNPASDRVILQLKASGNAQQVTVTDLNGRQILTLHDTRQGDMQFGWSVRHWPAGIYLIRVTDGQRMSVRKLVVK